jgi:cleavage and polyadenylation specificity factor subunit 4
MSSSVPKIDRDWEAEFMFEEDYVPGTLANEVLTPAEKMRRGSSTNTVRMAADEPSGIESMPIGATKFGSPVMAASPSRWGPLFQRHKEENELDGAGSGRSLKHVSAFGHVGSPLRNSSLASAIAAELYADESSNGNGEKKDSSGNESVSALTRQLRETRLSEGGSGSSGPHFHPAVARNSKTGNAGAGIIGRERERERALERHISAGSSTSGVTRFTAPIDEEDSPFVFRMEEEESDAQSRARKRGSGGAASPLSTGWSYANAAANNNKRSSNATANAPKSGAGNGAVETVGGR